MEIRHSRLRLKEVVKMDHFVDGVLDSGDRISVADSDVGKANIKVIGCGGAGNNCKCH